MLEWVFGKRITPAERLRKNQRLLDKAIRELDQTRVKLEKQEKTLIQQIKTSAKNGQMGACKIQAKDLVRTRPVHREVLRNAKPVAEDLSPAAGTHATTPVERIPESRS